MNKAYKYRIYPNKEQEVLIKKTFGCVRFIYNQMLANAQLNLNTPYRNFFRDQSVGFPKFKSKHRNKKSYTTNNQNGTIRVVDKRHIRLPKIKDIRIKMQ